MRHRRIQKSDRHKKLKTISEPEEIRFVKNDIIKKQSDQNSIPRKLKEILELKNQMNKKDSRKESSKKQKNICVKPSENFTIEHGMTRLPKPLPEAVIKDSSESNHHFMNRLNRMVAQSLAEANLEEHFDVDLGDNLPQHPNSKDQQQQQKPTKTKNKPTQETDLEDLDDDSKKRLERKREKNRKNCLRRKAKKLVKQHRLVKQLNKIDDLKCFKQDPVHFGEVAHCPPNFTFKKQKQNKKC